LRPASIQVFQLLSEELRVIGFYLHGEAKRPQGLYVAMCLIDALWVEGIMLLFFVLNGRRKVISRGRYQGLIDLTVRFMSHGANYNRVVCRVNLLSCGSGAEEIGRTTKSFLVCLRRTGKVSCLCASLVSICVLEIVQYDPFPVF
jgi:hypothetical protein